VWHGCGLLYCHKKNMVNFAKVAEFSHGHADFGRPQIVTLAAASLE